VSATNRVVAGWVLEERLGSGGFGEVWKARRRHVDVFRALKLTPVSDEAAFASWRHEISRLAELEHPNIVRFYDADIVAESGPYDDCAWIATELCERSLADELQMRDPHLLTPVESAQLVEEMLGALAAAHSNGGVHRDVKPANMLWHRSGVWKLCDFGTARLITPGESHPRTAVVGTFPYMSPAAHRGQQDQAADLYALGVTVHEALSGVRLHPRGLGMTNSEYVKFILDTPPTISPNLPPAWRSLVEALIDGRHTAAELLGQVRRSRASLAQATGDEPTREDTSPTTTVASPSRTAVYPERDKPPPARPSRASRDHANLLWIAALTITSLTVAGLLLNQALGNAVLVTALMLGVAAVLILVILLD